MKRFFCSILSIFFAFAAFSQAKYVFYFIGDGMGPNAVLAAEMYLAERNGKINRHPLCMTQFPVSGQLGTFSASNSITDSSAAGTCLATGSKTNNGCLGIDESGKELMSIAEMLQHRQWGIGIVTSVSIDHATPAAFYANVKERGDYYNIGLQLADSRFDFFAGASFCQPTNPKNINDKNLYDVCQNAGYLFAHGMEEYNQYRDATKQMILVQEGEGVNLTAPGRSMLPYAIDRKPEELSLPQLTSAAIDFLMSKDEKRPFFLMVEGGAIDWACHSNDAATAIREVLDFDRAISKAYEFYKDHPSETLIVVTADHETGGLALGNSDYTLNLSALQHQHYSKGKISDHLKALHQQYGKKLTYEQVKRIFETELGLYDKVAVSKEEDAALRATFKLMMKNKTADAKTLYASFNTLADQAVALLNRKAKIGWTTGGHSAAAVPVFAIGVGAEHFTGWHDNSEVMTLILQQTETAE